MSNRASGKGALATVLAMAALMTAGCGGDDSDDLPASFSMTDAPADDVERVQLTVDRIELKQQGAAAVDIQLEQPMVFDNLLDLRGSVAQELLPDRSFPAGQYQWVRLYVVGGGDDSYVMTDTGGQVNLFVPGQQSAGTSRFVQLSSGFVIPAGGSVDFVIDVDLRKALTKPSGQDYYLLRPALRIIDRASSGEISGTVAPSLLDDVVCTNDLSEDEGNAVYLFSADAAGTDDVYIDAGGQAIGEAGPISVALVTQNTVSGQYEYEFGFVAPGQYRVALTCQARDDMPESDDDISFQQSATVEVTAEVETEFNFQL